ncbi:TorF family putative porin [Sphingorhabdus buctiana]|uniref:TorF family putative porin n=2 Tax=Sphingorhabdus TaxID=1434046 RepID=A0ABW4MCR9_9SPHN
MRKSIFKLAAACVVVGSMSAAAPAFAQDEAAEEAEGPFTVSGGIAVVSDYRFRGVSLSDKDFAVQPTLTVSHESGFYVGVWGSNIAENPGEDIEVDLYAGFAGGDTVTYDLGVTYYMYPGVSAFNYAEFIGKLGTTVGPVTLGGMVAYAPSQDGTGNTDNFYLGTNASIGIPNTPLSLSGSIGYEDGAFGDDKIDWSLGVTAEVKGFTLGASYVDTNRFVGGLGKAGAVFSISYGF